MCVQSEVPGLDVSRFVPVLMWANENAHVCLPVHMHVETTDQGSVALFTH